MSTSFLDDLQQRNLIHQMSDPSLADKLSAGPMVGYAGFDPTADSLHVGSLLPLVTLKRFQQAGHKPIGLVGGGTGLIGDPSGKATERTLLTREALDKNVAGIRAQVERFLDFDAGAQLVNNADWLCELNLLDFLRDIGKNFSVNQMIVRDCVRNRLETREQGLSYTEFTYILLQSYDFLALYDKCGCNLQFGGSDQWGNIVSGADLIRRLRNAEAFGLTMPLITRSDGKKFGKSEEGNIWLDPERTSPYQFFQFWLNTDDNDVIRYMDFLTFLSVEDRADLAKAVQESPEKREAQKVLATELTKLVHGDDGLNRAVRVSEFLFDKKADYRQMTEQELKDAFKGAPATEFDANKLGTPDAGLLAVLTDTGLYPSRGRARKDVPNGAVSVNNVAVKDIEYVLSDSDLLPGGFIILRKGKKTYHVVRVA